MMVPLTRALLLLMMLFLSGAAWADDYDAAEAEAEAMDEGGDGGGYDDGYGGYGDDDYGGGGGGGGADFSSEIKGFVELDEYTFDKVVDGTKAAFAVFYEPYASDLEDAVAEVEGLAEDFGEHSSLHLVKVNIESNPAFVERFGITADALPKAKKEEDGIDEDADADEDDDMPPTKKAFLFFPAGDDKPVKVTAELNKAALGEFLTAQVGETGTVSALVGVFTDFVKKLSNAKEVAKLTEKAQGIVKGLKGTEKTFGEYYVKVMSNLVKKGKDYVQSEHGRLTRMVEAGGLKEEKVTEFNRRKRILRALARVQGTPISLDKSEL